MSGHGKGSRSDPQDLSRRTFMGYVGTVTATCAAGALGIRCGGEEGPEARKHPDRHDVSIDGYLQSRFGLGLDNIYWGDLHTHTLYSFDAPIWCRCQALPEDSCRNGPRNLDRGLSEIFDLGTTFITQPQFG